MKRRDDLSKQPLDKTIEAIEARNLEDAKMFARQIWDEFRPLHDSYGDTNASLLTFIAKKLGEEAVLEAYRYMAEDFWKPVVMMMKEQGVDASIGFFCTVLRAHGSEFYCEEDDEKYIIVTEYCGSGGRMMKEGKNDTSERSPLNFGTTKKPYPWSFNKTGISYYCCHCAIWLETLAKEWGFDVFRHEFGRQFDDNGNPLDEPCVTTVYKTPR